VGGEAALGAGGVGGDHEVLLRAAGDAQVLEVVAQEVDGVQVVHRDVEEPGGRAARTTPCPSP